MWTCPDCGREFKRANQHHFCANAPKTMDEYIARQRPEAQPMLTAVREAVRAAVPDAEEGIAWSMPNWKRGRNFLQMAVNKEGISLYAGQPAIAVFGERLDGYETKKDAIYFKEGSDIPTELVSAIAKWCSERAAK